MMGTIAVLLLATLAGADLSEQDRALLQAVRSGTPEEVRGSLAEGANPDAVDDSFWVPAALIAAEYGNVEHLRVLLDAGADPNAQGHGIHYLGTTPLMAAGRFGHVPAMELLIARGATVDEGDDLGWTPLIVAAGARDPEVVRVLLDHGADPRKKTDSGHTALMAAANVGDMPTLRLLLAAGGDAAARDDQRRTAADWAVLGRQTEAAHFLAVHLDSRKRKR